MGLVDLVLLNKAWLDQIEPSYLARHRDKHTLSYCFLRTHIVWFRYSEQLHSILVPSLDHAAEVLVLFSANSLCTRHLLLFGWNSSIQYTHVCHDNTTLRHLSSDLSFLDSLSGCLVSTWVFFPSTRVCCSIKFDRSY